ADLRAWNLLRGRVAKARQVTVGDLDCMPFAEFVAAALEDAAETRERRTSARLIPHWDQATRTLTYGTFSRTFVAKATNQGLLLQAFERAGWLQELPSPMAREETKQTLKDLNATLEQAGALIRFGRADKGKKVTWRLLPPTPPALSP